MFLLSKPAQAVIEAKIATAHNLPIATPVLLTLSGGLIAAHTPRTFAHDFSQSELGRGPDIFARARHAFSTWTQFDLGWVRIANPETRIDVGSIVAVEVHAGGLWSLNLNRIMETIDSPTQFGFLYATTKLHVEEGQERFLLEYDPRSQTVTYLLEAISRPRHPLARLAYPFTRAMQHRFATESRLRMRLTAPHAQ